MDGKGTNQRTRSRARSLAEASVSARSSQTADCASVRGDAWCEGAFEELKGVCHDAKALERVLGDDDKYASDDLERLARFTREYWMERGLRGDYDEGRVAQVVNRAVIRELTHRDNDVGGGDGEREALLTREARESVAKAEARLREFDATTAEKRSELLRQHREMDEAFEQRWRTGDSVQRYRRPSCRLLQLKYVERALALAGRLDDAAAIRGEVDCVMSTEQRACQDRLIADYEAARQRQVERQRRELQVFDDSRGLMRQALEKERGNAVDGLERRASVVKASCCVRRSIRRPDVSRQLNASVRSLTDARYEGLRNPFPPDALFPPNAAEFQRRQRALRAEKSRLMAERQRAHARAVLSEWSPEGLPELQRESSALCEGGDGERLFITVVDAKDVKGTEHFVRATLEGVERKTKALANAGTVVWDERLEFGLPKDGGLLEIELWGDEGQMGKASFRVEGLPLGCEMDHLRRLGESDATLRFKLARVSRDGQISETHEVDDSQTSVSDHESSSGV